MSSRLQMRFQNPVKYIRWSVFSFSPIDYFCKTLHLMFDRVLNKPLDYSSCFAEVVLRWIYGKVDICQTDYSVHSKLRIFRYSEVMHRSATFKLTKG